MTWTLKNPAYRYEVLTDENAVTYVEQHYGPNGFNRPDIVSIYKGLSARIIQADLLRYLIMYVEGGLWSDIDVEAIRPIDHFIPKRHSEHDVGMVVGVETDEPALKDHPVLGAKATSFCQWTFMCKPRLPVMMRLIDNILIWLSRLAVEQGRSISELELNFDEVLNGTGPSAFTTAILAEMTASTGRKYTWDDFHDLEESKVVGGVLVLTSEAFAAGTGHSDSGNHHGKGALVKHHFHASSWTTNHPRFKHPIYGEVEKCNWDVECVKLWDANTAFFASLPKEDQRKMIGLKDREETAAALDAEFAAAMPMLPKAGPPPAVMPEAPGNDFPALDGSAQEPLAATQAEIQPVDVPAGNEAPLLADSPPAIAGLGLAAAQPESQPEARSEPEQDTPAGIPEGLEPGLAAGLDQVDWPVAAPAEPVGELVDDAE
ncbi:hypothetical protein LTR78_003274 [Recurvomyces mirabilis]|uniref:Uncharacterized protein n=1 Tax=Recurvomyces mirabilis TaxID=574656 RepID=A0AAE0WSK8_9PEZI|nr:hypothetical protein LTR78_003274 [Recurvomyces mirabilis]KAK5156908.1 hypothetical protein LTS14_004425 [Recurvomyces mirabilis]